MIRKARQTDAPGIAKLLLQFWETHDGCDPLLKFEKPISLAQQIRYARKAVGQKGTIALVAFEKGVVLGYIELLIKKNEPGLLERRFGYLNLLVVHKNTRGKGIGAALVKEALRMLQAKGIQHVRANVYLSNQKALRFWAKNGFQGQSEMLMRSI